MNPVVGVLLAALLFAAAWRVQGWQGGVFAATVIAFWLILQFNRALRVMKNAASAPVGHIDSGVMFHAKLRRGMTMLNVVSLARSLGRKVSDVPETWAWSDGSGAKVVLVFAGAKLDRWEIIRIDPGTPQDDRQE